MYRVKIKRDALKEISWLPQHIQDHVIQSIDTLNTNPHPVGSKKLAGSTDRWRIRVGEFRMLYTINDATKHIVIYRIVHRKDAYR